jgi:7-cyano-7-deazaguanine synthase
MLGEVKLNAALVIFSGGQDSTTCLYWAKQRYHQVHALTFNYGQRHAREIDAAIKIAELAEVASHEILTVGPILKGTSPLVSDNKLEQYQDWHALPGGLEKTFVPGRNALFHGAGCEPRLRPRHQ